MEQLNLRKLKESKNGATLEFRYEGIQNNVFDKEKTEKLIESFLSKDTLHQDMIRNIIYLRTILKDTEEKLLVVKYENDDSTEIVKYDNGFLFSFECKKVNSEDYIEAKFTPCDGLTVSFGNFGHDHIMEPIQAKNTKDKFAEIVDHIASLRKASCVYLDNDSKAVIEAYKLFYNENLDFSKEDINIKIQTMMSILVQFNICFGDYSFNINDKMPESIRVAKMVNHLFPLGEVVAIEDPIELKEEAKETIKMVGETIREAIVDESDINEELIALSKTIYAGRYNIASIHDVKKLTEDPNLNLTFNEAESSTQLVKKIEMKLNKNR